MHRALFTGALILLFIAVSTAAPAALALPAEQEEKPFVEKRIGTVETSDMGLYRLIIEAIKEISRTDAGSAGDVMAMPGYVLSEEAYSNPSAVFSGDPWEKLILASKSEAIRIGLLHWLSLLRCTDRDRNGDPFVFGVKIEANLELDDSIPGDIKNLRDELLQNLTVMFIGVKAEANYFKVIDKVEHDDEGKTSVAVPYTKTYTLNEAINRKPLIETPDANYLYIVLVVPRDRDTALAMARKMLVKNNDGKLTLYLYRPTYTISLDSSTSTYKIDIDSVDDNVAKDGIRDTDIYSILKDNRNLRRLFESYMKLVASGSISNNMLTKSTLEDLISNVLESLKDDIKSYFRNQITSSLVSKNKNYTAELEDITVSMPSVSIEGVSGLKFARMLYPGLIVYVSTEITVKTSSMSGDNSYFSFNVPEKTFTNKSSGYEKVGSLRLSSKDTGNDAEISYAKIMLVDRLVAYGQVLTAIAGQTTSVPEGDGNTYTFKIPGLQEVTDATPLSDLSIDLGSRIIGFTAPDSENIQLLQPSPGASGTWVLDNGKIATIAGLALVPDQNFYTVYDIRGLTGSLGVLKDIIRAYRGLGSNDPVPLGLIPSAITHTGLSDSDIVAGGVGNIKTVDLGTTGLFNYTTIFRAKWLPLDKYESSSKADKLLDIMLVTSSGETEITASKTVNAAQDYGYVYTMPSAYYDKGSGEVTATIRVKNATSGEVIDTYSYTASITVETVSQKILFRIITIEEGDIDVAVKHIRVKIDVHIGKADDVSETVKNIKENLPDLTGTARISFLPAYAPLWGTGVPTKIFSEVSYLASILEGSGGSGGDLSYGAAEFGYRFDTYLSQGTSTDWVNAALKYLVPTYIPIPAPESIGSHKIGLNRFAPGEYMGGYIVVDYSWPSEYTNALKAAPAPKLITIIAEKVTVEFDGAQGIVTSETVDGQHPHLIYKPGENKITMYTLGIGFGTPGTIGKRLYVLPSKALIPERVMNNPEKPGSGSRFNDVFGLIKKALKKNGTMGEALVEVTDNIGNGGLYFQLTPYFGDRSNRWAYFMLTTGTYDRFVVGNSPGVHHVKVDAKLSAIHILVVKIPILGIPIPIPIPLAWEYDEDGPPGATRVGPDIYVSSIHPVILASYYDPVTSDEPFTKQLSEKGANYIAATVWYDQGASDEKEKYLGPVLLRGPYGYYYHYSESGSMSATPYTWWSSLGVALIDPDTGEAYSVEPVYDIGFSIKPLKITYRDMQKIKIDPRQGGKLYLQPVFIYGSSYVAVGSPVEIPVYRLVVKTASIRIGGGKVIQVAFYGLEGRGKTRWQEKILDFIDDVKEKLSSLKEKLDNGKAKFDEAMTEINNAFTRQTGEITDIVDNAWNGLRNAVGDAADGLIGNIRNFVIAYLKYTATKVVEQIITKITEKIISSVAAALAPDPTGGALSGIIQSIIEEAMDTILDKVEGFIDKTFGNTGIAEGFLEKYGIFGIIVLIQAYVQEKVLKDIMYRYLQDYIMDPLKDYVITKIAHIIDNITNVHAYLEQLKNGVDETYGMVDRAYRELMDLIDQARDLIESIPYPVLFARAYAVTGDGEVMHAYGYIGRASNGVFDTLLPIDSIEYPEGTRTLFIIPYTLPIHIHVAAADTELDVEMPNININVKGSVIYAVAVLKYLNTIGVLGNERYNSIAGNLYSISSSIENVHETVDPYAELLFLDPEQPLIVPAILSS